MFEYQSKPRSGTAKAVAICGAGLLVGTGLCGLSGITNSGGIAIAGIVVFVVSFFAFLFSVFLWIGELLVKGFRK